MITNIANAYIGDSSISRIYQGEELVYENSHPDIRLEYIANGPDGGADNPDVYFDTGFAPKLATRAEFKYEAHVNQVGRIFGCGNSNTANTMYNFNTYASGNTPDGTAKTSLKFFYRGGNVAASITPEVDTPYTVTLYGTYSGTSASAINMIVNGTTYTRSVSASTDITASQSAYIFRWHGYDNNTSSGIKFYYVKMWNENNLIRFYIPVLHYINGQYTPCFYDKVNGNYIYNLGTDTPTYKMSGDYLLDYIYRPSGQSAIYYNTTTQVARGLGIDVKFASGSSISNGDTNENIIVGVRDASGNKYGVYAPYSGTAGSTTVTWHPGLRGLGYNLGSSVNGAFNTVYKTSTSPTTSNKVIYVNNTASSTTTAESSTAGAIGAPIGIFGNTIGSSVQCSFANTRVYYCSLTNSNNSPRKTYIPVLHDNEPVFYDLINNIYLSNSGSGTPGYLFLK